MSRKWVRSEGKSDLSKILMVPWALFTLCPPPLPNRFINLYLWRGGSVAAARRTGVFRVTQSAFLVVKCTSSDECRPSYQGKLENRVEQSPRKTKIRQPIFMYRAVSGSDLGSRSARVLTSGPPGQLRYDGSFLRWSGLKSESRDFAARTSLNIHLTICVSSTLSGRCA